MSTKHRHLNFLLSQFDSELYVRNVVVKGVAHINFSGNVADWEIGGGNLLASTEIKPQAAWCSGYQMSNNKFALTVDANNTKLNLFSWSLVHCVPAIFSSTLFVFTTTGPGIPYPTEPVARYLVVSTTHRGYALSGQPNSYPVTPGMMECYRLSDNAFSRLLYSDQFFNATMEGQYSHGATLQDFKYEGGSYDTGMQRVLPESTLPSQQLPDGSNFYLGSTVLQLNLSPSSLLNGYGTSARGLKSGRFEFDFEPIHIYQPDENSTSTFYSINYLPTDYSFTFKQDTYNDPCRLVES